MNPWTWANIGKPMWLVLKRRGLNRDLRRLFMKRYTDLMNHCLFERHMAYFNKILPGCSLKISWTSMRQLLEQAHCTNTRAIAHAIDCLIIGKTHSTAIAWLDPEDTWKQDPRFAVRIDFDDEK